MLLPLVSLSVYTAAQQDQNTTKTKLPSNNEASRDPETRERKL